MNDFNIKGKIIDNQNQLAIGVSVKAYNHHTGFLGDSNLGETITDNNGTFQIKFNESKFERFRDILQLGCHVYLIVEYEGEDGTKRIFKTKTERIEKELEYHIKLAEYIPDPFVVDIYANSTQRLINIMNGTGLLLRNQQINLTSLTHGNLPEEVKKQYQQMLNGHDDRQKMFDYLNALITGYIASTSSAIRLDEIGYDVPQVPKNAWREGEHEVIVWSRKESI